MRRWIVKKSMKDDTGIVKHRNAAGKRINRSTPRPQKAYGSAHTRPMNDTCSRRDCPPRPPNQAITRKSAVHAAPAALGAPAAARSAPRCRHSTARLTNGTTQPCDMSSIGDTNITIVKSNM